MPTDTDLPPVARVIRDRLAELGMGVADLAGAAALDLSKLAYVVRGDTRDPRLSTVRAVCRGLRLSPGQFEQRLRAAEGRPT